DLIQHRLKVVILERRILDPFHFATNPQNGLGAGCKVQVGCTRLIHQVEKRVNLRHRTSRARGIIATGRKSTNVLGKEVVAVGQAFNKSLPLGEGWVRVKVTREFDPHPALRAALSQWERESLQRSDNNCRARSSSSANLG